MGFPIDASPCGIDLCTGVAQRGDYGILEVPKIAAHKGLQSAREAARDPVTVPDLHATCLHLLGLDHTWLTYPHLGRDYRLTDVSGSVLHRLIV